MADYGTAGGPSRRGRAAVRQSDTNVPGRLLRGLLTALAEATGWLALALFALARRLLTESRIAAGVLLRAARRRPQTTLDASVFGVAALALAVLWQYRNFEHARMADSLECLALNIYHEARGESDAGKLAVGQVVMNRVADPGFPNEVCAVVKQKGRIFTNRCHFSWWCDGLTDRPTEARAWTEAQSLAGKILAGQVEDPTGGALWYHADSVAPDWRTKLVPLSKIGHHQFYTRPAKN